MISWKWEELEVGRWAGIMACDHLEVGTAGSGRWTGRQGHVLIRKWAQPGMGTSASGQVVRRAGSCDQPDVGT